MAEANGKLTAIYVLRDECGSVRYVGKTINPKKRFESYRWPAPTQRSPCANWCREMRARGFQPAMEVLDWVTDWETAERRAIARFREEGADLLNVQPGGQHPGPYKRQNDLPAYRWALAFCRRRGLKELASLLQTRMKEMTRRGPDNMAAFDASLFDGIYEASPLAAVRLTPRLSQ